ncbi:MAG: pilus assembly PilX N-terminal domain-containing protein [Planctomycetes bacterium]|nr:pilus assembly PilX N-terminal domain-containing protein [Planctomycetota bacterium]
MTSSPALPAPCGPLPPAVARRSGTVLVMAVSILVFLTLIGITFVLVSGIERRVALNRLDRVRSRLVAETGINMAQARIIDDLKGNTNLFGLPEEQVRRAQPISRSMSSVYSLPDDSILDETGAVKTNLDQDASPSTIHGRPVQGYSGYAMDSRLVQASATNPVGFGHGQEMNTPGTYEALGDKYRLRIADAQGMINLKSFDTRQPSSFGGSPPADFDPAQRPRLRMLLLNLGEFIRKYINNRVIAGNSFYDKAPVCEADMAAKNPFPATVVDKLLDALSGLETKQDLREFMNRELAVVYPATRDIDYFPLIEPYVTMTSWPDGSDTKYLKYRIWQNTYVSDWNKSTTGRLGEPLVIPKNATLEEGFRINIIEVKNPVTSVPRAPININTAPRPVIASLIYGLGARVPLTYAKTTMTSASDANQRNPIFKYGPGGNDYYREVLYYEPRAFSDLSGPGDANTKPPTNGGTNAVFNTKVVEVFPFHDQPTDPGGDVNFRTLAWNVANAIYNRVHPGPVPPPPAPEPFNPFRDYHELEDFILGLWDDAAVDDPVKANNFRLRPDLDPATQMGFIREMPWTPDDTRAYGAQISDWNPYVNSAGFASLPEAKAQFARWYNRVAKSILLANFNTNTRFQFTNPSAHARVPVSKLDLVYRVPEPTDTGYIAPLPGGSTEVVYNPGGVFEIAAYGEVTAPAPKDDVPETDPNFGKITPGTVVARSSIRTLVSLWDMLHMTSQEDFDSNSWDFGAGPINAALLLVRGRNDIVDVTSTVTYPMMIAPQYLNIIGFPVYPPADHRRAPSKFDGYVELKPRIAGGNPGAGTASPFSAPANGLPGPSFEVTFDPDTHNPAVPFTPASNTVYGGRDFNDPMSTPPPFAIPGGPVPPQGWPLVAEPFSIPFSGSQFMVTTSVEAPYVMPIFRDDPGPGGRVDPANSTNTTWLNGFPTVLRPDGLLMTPWGYKSFDINALVTPTTQGAIGVEDNAPNPQTRYNFSQQILHTKYTVFAGSDFRHYFGGRSYINVKMPPTELSPVPPAAQGGLVRQFLSDVEYTIDTSPGNPQLTAMGGPGGYATALDLRMDTRMQQSALSPYSGLVEFWLKFNDDLVSVNPEDGRVSGLFIATIPMNYHYPQGADPDTSPNTSNLNNPFTTDPTGMMTGGGAPIYSRATEGVQLVCFVDNQGMLRFSRIYYGDIPATGGNPNDPAQDAYLGTAPFRAFLSDSVREPEVLGNQSFAHPDVRMYGWGTGGGPPNHRYAKGPSGGGNTYPYARQFAQKWAETHAFVPLVDKTQMTAINASYGWLSNYMAAPKTIFPGEWHHYAIAWQAGRSYERLMNSPPDDFRWRFNPVNNPHNGWSYADYPYYAQYVTTTVSPGAITLTYPVGDDGAGKEEVQVWIDGKPQIVYSGGSKNNRGLVFNYGLNTGDVVNAAGSFNPLDTDNKVIIKTYKKLNEVRPEELLFLNSVVRRQHHIQSPTLKYDALFKFAKANSAGEVDPEKPAKFLAQLVSNATMGYFRSYALTRAVFAANPNFMTADYSATAPSRFNYSDPAGTYETAFVNPYDYPVKVQKVTWTQYLPPTNPLNAYRAFNDAGVNADNGAALNQKFRLWAYSPGGDPNPPTPTIGADGYQTYSGPYVQLDLRTYQVAKGTDIPLLRSGYLQHTVSPQSWWGANGRWEVTDLAPPNPQLEIPGKVDVAPAGAVNDQRGILLVRADWRTNGIAPLVVSPTLDDVSAIILTKPRILARTEEPTGP